jgi:hypothetical protein
VERKLETILGWKEETVTVINNEPLSSEDLKTQTLAPKHAVDEFIRQIERNPTRTELSYIGRWPPHAAIRQAELNPDGEPAKLVSVKVPNVWKDVAYYCDLAVNRIHGAGFGLVSTMRSIRYHDGDDSLWPMRDSNGDLVRNDGGHILQSLTFRAPHMSMMNANDCTWPEDTAEKGMWHVLEILRPMHAMFIGKTPPKHLIVESLPQNYIVKSAHQTELEQLKAEVAEMKKAQRR